MYRVYCINIVRVEKKNDKKSWLTLVLALFLILSSFVTILTFSTVHGYQATIRANGSSNHAPVNANVASGLAYDGTKGMVTMWFDHAYISQFPAMQNMSADGIKGGILIVYDKANTGGYGSWSDLKEKQKEGWEL